MLFILFGNTKNTSHRIKQNQKKVLSVDFRVLGILLKSNNVLVNSIKKKLAKYGNIKKISSKCISLTSYIWLSLNYSLLGTYCCICDAYLAFTNKKYRFLFNTYGLSRGKKVT